MKCENYNSEFFIIGATYIFLKICEIFIVLMSPKIWNIKLTVYILPIITSITIILMIYFMVLMPRHYEEVENEM